MNEQEFYRKYQEGKKQSEASGIDALIRDVELTGEGAVEEAKYAVDKTVDEVDDDVTEMFEKARKDVDDSVKGVKNEIKQDVGIGNADKSRYDKADELVENIKEPEKDEEMYISRKRARYQ